MVRIVLSVVVHLIENKIIVCYVLFASKCETSFLVSFKVKSSLFSDVHYFGGLLAFFYYP